MYNNKLSHRIVKLLETDHNKAYLLKEIARILHIGKYEYKDLNHTLSALVRERRIQRKQRRFMAIERPRTADIAPGITPASTPPVRPRSDSRVQGQLVEGVFNASAMARNYSFAFVETQETDVFVSAEDTLNAFHMDKVLVEVRYRRKDRAHGIIREVLQRNRDNFVGNIHRIRNQWWLVVDNPKIHRDIRLSDSPLNAEGKKAVCLVESWGVSRRIPPIARVQEILGDADDPRIELLGVIHDYQLPLEFPEEVIREADAIDDVIPQSEIDRRMDLRELTTLTIDPVSARDFDDALSIKHRDDGGFRLWVHIADVSSYVQLDSALFREAAERGNSYYFPRRVIPMLPEQLSNRLCSLRPDEEKQTMTVITDFDRDGGILSQSVHETVIRSDARLTYEQVDALFDGDPGEIDSEIVNQLEMMRSLSRILQIRRQEKGCLWFDLPDTEYVFDEEGFLSGLERSRETESHALVENFMLVANEYIALSLQKASPVSMYRIHEAPDPDRLDSIISLLKHYGHNVGKLKDSRKVLQKLLLKIENPDFHRVFDRMILRSMKKAQYSVKCVEHYGLATPVYTHFTSPIRRLCDLVIHHLIRIHLTGTEDKTRQPSSRSIDEWAKQASEREIIANDAERDVQRMSMLRFMKDRVGDCFLGLVVGMNNNNIFMELDDYPVTVSIPYRDLPDDHYRLNALVMKIVGKRSGRSYRLMDRFSVQIVRVDEEIIAMPVLHEDDGESE